MNNNQTIKVNLKQTSNLTIDYDFVWSMNATIFIDRNELVNQFKSPNNKPDSFIDAYCIFSIENTYFYGFCKIHLMNVSKHFPMHPTEECYKIIHNINASNWYYEFEDSDDYDDCVEIHEIYDSITIYSHLHNDAIEYIHTNKSYSNKLTFTQFKNHFDSIMSNDKNNYVKKIENIVKYNLNNKHNFSNYKASDDYKQELQNIIIKLQKQTTINNNQATLYFSYINSNLLGHKYIPKTNETTKVFLNKYELNDQFNSKVNYVEIDCVFVIDDIYFYGRLGIIIKSNLINDNTYSIVKIYDSVKIYQYLQKDADTYVHLNLLFCNETQFNKFKIHYNKLMYDNNEEYIKKLEDIIHYNLGNKNNSKNQIIDKKYKKELLNLVKKLQTK